MVLRDAFGQMALEDTQQDVLSTLTGFKNPSGAVLTGNARSFFRDGFSDQTVTQPNPAIWDSSISDASHIISQAGNANGSTYLTLSLSPFDDSAGIRLLSKQAFRFPFRCGFGISVSQRVYGQEVFFGLVGADDSGAVSTDASVPDVTLTGTASVTSNVVTLTIPNHGYHGGDRVVILGCPEPRLNTSGPVYITVVDRNTITYPISAPNGTYSVVNGIVRYADFGQYAHNGVGMLLENSTTTNGTFSTKRNGSRQRLLQGQTISSTGAAVPNSNPYTDSFVSAMTTEFYTSLEEVSYRSYSADSNGGISGSNKFSQGTPDEQNAYKVMIRARNLDGITKPIARVLTAAKAGTTAVTITTDTAHGLSVGDWVQLYGIKDQTNFPNSTLIQVASVFSATSFSAPFGPAATASSTGGAVIKNNGSQGLPGAIGMAVQSVSRANNILTVIGNTTWSGMVPGENVHLWGLEAIASAYEGAYKVLRVSGTTLELAAVGADFGSIATGGTVIKRTDVRIHFVRIMDYTRNYSEIIGGRGTNADANNAVPVAVTSSASVTVNQNTGTNGQQWNTGGWAGYLVNDIPSAAITTSVTSSVVTPGIVGNVGVNAHSFSAVVTAVSGTTPTLDLSVEESPDNGTNWFRIYDFPRITANGTYVSPIIPATWGTRYRYVRTVGGTTPSFTMAVNRMQHTVSATMLRSFIDRSIVMTTLNSTTPVYFVERAKQVQAVLSMGAATTPPVVVIEASEDNALWYPLGTLNAVASAIVVGNYNQILPKYLRARVSTVGAGVSAGYYLALRATE